MISKKFICFLLGQWLIVTYPMFFRFRLFTHPLKHTFQTFLMTIWEQLRSFWVEKWFVECADPMKIEYPFSLFLPHGTPWARGASVNTPPWIRLANLTRSDSNRKAIWSLCSLNHLNSKSITFPPINCLDFPTLMDFWCLDLRHPNFQPILRSAASHKYWTFGWLMANQFGSLKWCKIEPRGHQSS